MTSTHERYIELLKRTLTDQIYERSGNVGADGTLYDDTRRTQGRDWPSRAHTMIGRLRLDNIQRCAERVFEDGIPGDFMETGVWRGGATIFMRALLDAHGDTTRRVWVADSFCGLPPPDPERYPADKNDPHHQFAPLSVSLDEVKSNFDRYGLLDERVVFVEGFFRDTLGSCGIERLALLRLDGDMYESTIQALEALYPKLSPGGYCIIDDYGAIPTCAQAVDDFRRARNITEELVWIDWTGVYWRRK